MVNSLKTRLVRSILYFTGFFLIGLSLWTWRFFGPVSIDQALWTLSFGSKGVLTADSVYIHRFITWALVWPLKLSIIFLILEWLLAGKNITIFRPLPILFLITGILYFSYQYDVLQYLKQAQKPDKDYFQLNYTDANTVSFKNKHPKSLILIYVESLEATYADPELFGRDLLKKLKPLQKNQLVFSSFKQVQGTGWTVGGLVASQCAIPLKSLTIMGNNRIGENVSYFLPKVKCLGDILSESGYKNVFMEGSSLFVGGKGKFLEKHGYTERHGLDDWLAKGYKEADMNHWGLPDDELFKQAKIKFDELMQSKQPFNLTLLTVDTHGVTGQLNKTCKAQGYHDFAGIVECTTGMIADLLKYMIEKGALDRANIIVLGDHLAMSNDLNAQLAASKARTIFNLIISAEKFTKISDEIVHFDLLPTMLDSLGFDYSRHKLGLGMSAIHPENHFAKNRISSVEEQVAYDSDFYKQLWLPESAT